jgi:hypothetical protein
VERKSFTRRDIRKALNHLIALLEKGAKRGIDKPFVIEELKFIRTQMANGRISLTDSNTRIVPNKLCSRFGCGHHKFVHKPRCLKCVEEDREPKCMEYMPPRSKTELLQIEAKQPNTKEEHDK